MSHQWDKSMNPFGLLEFFLGASGGPLPLEELEPNVTI